jgi:tetratricopeptide (TPR) repeat protein
MKRFIIIFLLLFLACTNLFAQNVDLQLARQFSANGEEQKALEIYQKLYKQNNDAYYNDYLKSLVTLKKFADAESISKKMVKKYPANPQYSISLGKVYREGGHADKAEQVYADLLKNMPGNYNGIVNLANLFYQAQNLDMTIKVFLQGRKLLKDDEAFSMELISVYRSKRDKAGLITEYLSLLPKAPEYLNQAESVLASLLKDDTDYDLLKAELLKRIQQSPQEEIFPELLTWQYLQQKDYEQALNQALALSRRRNDDGDDVFDLCRTLVANGAYDEAIRGYEYIINKPNRKDQQLYITARIELINTKNRKITEGKYTEADLLALEKDYNDLLAEFGRTGNTAFAIKQLAQLEAFKLHKPDVAQQLLEDAIKIPNLNNNMSLASLKLDLGDVYLMNNQPWEATLIYSQVEKANNDVNTTQDAKLHNAKLSYYTGDFNWAKNQLDVLKAATSQLIANDALNLSLLIKDNTAGDSTGAALKMYARADLLIFEQLPEKAITILDSIDKKYPDNNLTDDILMSKARILIQQKSYAAAVPLLSTIAEDHKFDLWADDAIFMLGDIYENNLQDKEKAKTYYQRIITDYPGSLWINEARKRFRILRGDKLDGPS